MTAAEDAILTIIETIVKSLAPNISYRDVYLIHRQKNANKHEGCLAATL